MYTVLEIVLGAFLTILITIFFENARKPKLEIRISSPTDKQYVDRPAKDIRFIGLEAVNRSIPRPLKWILRETATQCHGLISFYHLDGQSVFSEDMIARWTTDAQPLDMEGWVEVKRWGKIRQNKIVIRDENRLTVESRMDIPAGESRSLNIVAKMDNETACYGWNNESYFNNWRNPNRKLDNGRYLVKATIISSGNKCVNAFRLINDVSLLDFRLEPATKEDKKKLGIK